MSYKNRTEIAKTFEKSDRLESVFYWNLSKIDSSFTEKKLNNVFSIYAQNKLSSSLSELTQHFSQRELNEVLCEFEVTDKILRHNFSKTKQEEQSTELSNYTITSEGVFAEKWDAILNIEARVVKSGNDKVVVECLVDSGKVEFENRSFDKSFFDGIPTTEKYPVLIKIFKRKNELKYQFLDGRGLFDLSKFDVDPFKDVDFNFLNKKF
jgi:hypothetical protein